MSTNMFTLRVHGKTLELDGWDDSIECFCPCNDPPRDILTFTKGFPPDLLYRILRKDITHIHVSQHRWLNSEWGVIESATMEHDRFILTYRYADASHPLKADDYDSYIPQGERLIERLSDDEVQKIVKKSTDVVIDDIDYIRVRPAAQRDELAIEIASKTKKRIHLLVKGHYA